MGIILICPSETCELTCFVKINYIFKQQTKKLISFFFPASSMQNTFLFLSSSYPLLFTVTCLPDYKQEGTYCIKCKFINAEYAGVIGAFQSYPTLTTHWRITHGRIEFMCNSERLYCYKIFISQSLWFTIFHSRMPWRIQTSWQRLQTRYVYAISCCMMVLDDISDLKFKSFGLCFTNERTPLIS